VSLFSNMTDSVEVRRPTITQSNEMAATASFRRIATTKCRIYQLSASEQVIVNREGVRATHAALMESDVDVQAQDELWLTKKDSAVIKYHVNTIDGVAIADEIHHQKVMLTTIE